MKSLIYLAIIWGVFTFMSCSKNDEKASISVNNTEEKSVIESTFDAGRFHGLGLDYIISHKSDFVNDGVCNESDFIATIQDYTLLHLCDLPLESATLNMDSLKTVIRNFSETLIKLIKSGEFSVSFADTVTGNFYNDIQEVVNSDLFADTIAVKNYIAGIINSSQNSSISSEDKAVIKIVAQIAQNSWIYWYREFAGVDSEWINSGIKSSCDWFGAMRTIVTADIEGGIAGAIVGGYTGATGGSVIPGAGTITGCIAGVAVGGCVGSVSSSAVSAGIQLYSWLF